MNRKIKVYFMRLWLNFRLKKGDLIKVDDRHRGIGKTTIMVKLAQKKGYTIIVGNQGSADYIKHRDRNIKIIRLAKMFTVEIRGQRANVLIDESVAPEMIENIKNEKGVNIRGGFIRNYRGEGNEI